jgi:hypothetical protein
VKIRLLGTSVTASLFFLIFNKKSIEFFYTLGPVWKKLQKLMTIFFKAKKKKKTSKICHQRSGQPHLQSPKTILLI